MSLGLYIGLLLLAILLFFVLRPLWQARASREELEAFSEDDLLLENLLFRREALLQGLRDLQMDLESGKLTAEDFESLDKQLRGEALVVLQQLDELGEGAPTTTDEDSLDEWIEAAVAAVRAQPREPRAPTPALTEQQRSKPV